MACLLDTHTFLWFLSGDEQLPPSTRQRIENISEQLFISVGSIWEIVIKQQIGKLKLEFSLKELFNYADINQVEIIGINYEHLFTLSFLPRHHNDPFDRLIISQAISENLTILSKDNEFKKYNVNIDWDS